MHLPGIHLMWMDVQTTQAHKVPVIIMSTGTLLVAHTVGQEMVLDNLKTCRCQFSWILALNFIITDT